MIDNNNGKNTSFSAAYHGVSTSHKNTIIFSINNRAHKTWWPRMGDSQNRKKIMSKF